MRERGRPASGFIHISEAANLALHALTLLAAEPSRPLRIRQVCEVVPVSENHLAKVLQRLVRAGLVWSARGPHGGFVLARPPEKVTLLEIYQAIEGEVQVHACLLGRQRCAGRCIFGELLSQTNAKIKARLERTRLSDLAGSLRRTDEA